MAESFQKTTRLLGRSIFFKLFLIFLMTALILVVGIRGFFFLGTDRDHTFKADLFNNLTRYSRHLVNEIGTPPNQQRAIALAQELGVQFRVDSPMESWATDPTLPPSTALILDHAFSDKTVQAGRFRRHPFVMVERQDTQYIIFFLHRPFGGLPAWLFVVIASFVALVIGGCYFVVRRLIRPVNWLSEGVKEIAKGHFEHQVPVASSDELGELSTSFNKMAKQVREMIQSRDRLLMDVSHELRSPLTRMKVAAEFIEQAPTQETIQHEIRELESMVTELLESERLHSHYGALVLTETDLVSLVRDIVDQYGEQEPGLHVVAAPSKLLLTLDSERVQMVLRNVFENAQKYSQPKLGPIEIWVERDSLSVRVLVQDHGPGIPEEDQALIFEPFYRVDKSRTRSTGGYGLGLSLAKSIMNAHGGDLLLTSELGHGCVFTLTFPVD